MPEDKKVENLIINRLTKEQYKNIEVKANDELYDIIDEEHYTSEELDALLKLKQNKLTAGENISIEEDTISATYTAGEGIDITNGVISNTQTSAEWGNIKGDISTQDDLQQSLNTKVDKEEGKSLISDTEIERLANVDNYDDTSIKDDIQSINTEIININNGLDNIEDSLNTKQNILIAGNNITLTPEGDSTRIDTTIPTISTDDITIVKDDDNIITAIGIKSKNNIISYDWIGTTEEYNNDLASGLITDTTKCFITDDETELTHLIDVNVPTKLSELANDTNFVNKTTLDSVKDNLQQQIYAGLDDSNLVHKTGSETIEGFKKFKEKVVVENDSNKGRIAHKNTSSSLEDGYIEFGENTLIYGKQNIQGEIYDEKKNIFHEGNLVAGDNITITKSNGVYKINGQEGGGTGGTTVYVDDATIVKDDQEIITTVGVKSKNGNILYDWVGTKEEYETAVSIGEIQPNWVCYITDDGIDVSRVLGSKSNTELDNLSEQGEKHFLNKQQISNCILEIPQRIKYTLQDGTLTIKKGSQVIVPYGTTNENFTKVGSPTIVDAIASGFSESDYLISTDKINTTKTTTLNITGKFKTDTISALQSVIELCNVMGGDSTSAKITLRFAANGTSNGFISNAGTQLASLVSSNIKLQANTEYDFSFSINGLSFEFRVGDFPTLSGTLSDYLPEGLYAVTIGRRYYINNYWQGSIDLKQFLIAVDDKVVYRPYLQKGDQFLHENFKVADIQYEDGKFFVWTELLNDIAHTYNPTMDVTCYIMANISTGSLVLRSLADTSWEYDYTTNLLSIGTVSFPFAIGIVGTTSWKSINQVFNGIGYVGSTVWVDKGVKGLIPNGYNEDGTLNNIEYTTPNLIIHNHTVARNNGSFIINTANGTGFGSGYYFDEKANSWAHIDGYYLKVLHVATMTTSGATFTISHFKPKSVFKATDYSDIDGQWIKKSATILTSTAVGTYTIDLSTILPDDGNVYEILFKGALHGNSSTDCYMQVETSLFSKTSLVNVNVNSTNGANIFIIPVASDRILKVYIAGVNANAAVCNIMAIRKAR